MAGSQVEAKTKVKTNDVGFSGEGVRDGRDRSSEGRVEDKDEVWSSSGQDFLGESGQFWQASRLMKRYGKDLSSGTDPDTGTGRAVQFLVEIRESGLMASDQLDQKVVDGEREE